MSANSTTNQATCPSAKCQPGSKLIGVVNEQGTVNMIHNPIVIDENFVTTAQDGRNPEARFRFANKCIKNGCSQWLGERCGVIDGILNHIEKTAEHHPLTQELRQCAIRPTCRWFNQTGKKACDVCTLVVTDVSIFQELSQPD